MTLTLFLLTVPPALALLLTLTDPSRYRPAATARHRRARHAAPRRRAEAEG